MSEESQATDTTTESTEGAGTALFDTEGAGDTSNSGTTDSGTEPALPA